ncbi:MULTISPECIES: DUF1822 family protein [Calothrix]|uniref:DUF1822 family protein n=2 Tax=Calothrix TaxID=1186 RepID=A0ABR8AJN1_9CYAN|nr:MULTISPECIES: DUF1822 family protein [Calothrix]MBD2200178.1 DUF1822 family protein [Calothrix parietina FACHB-288]MBD2229167.1 DUF1822 family protein [Calothrix anomala FACHB-343]
MFEQSIVKFINRNSQALNFSFSENDREKAWLQVNNSHQYSNDAACWNAFLNLLSQNIVSTWLKNELDLSQPIILSSPDIWEFVNGTSFSIGDKRIVIIPSEAIDNQEFSVPQEWVDIPKFVADYYLAVQIIPDELSLSIWGFTTHIELKNQGEYDAIERTYSLLSDDLISDINTFIVSLELCPQQREVIQTLPIISTNEAEYFIRQLSKPSAYLPHLDINFFKWGALLENDAWRQKLYKNRLITLIPLSSWQKNIENIFDAGWQTLEELFAASKVNLAFRMRNKSSNKQPDANTLKQIKELIEKIKNTADEGEKQIAAERLGKIGYQDQEIIDTLIYLIQTTKKEETRWTAAESLWIIDPKNSTVGVKRGIDLGMQLAGYPLALIVGVLEKSDGKAAILVQVNAIEKEKYLPSGCRMTVLDETGKTFSEVISREADRVIQKKFSGQQGERFSVKITLGDSCIGKDFII